ncbi:MAG: hypothetical protein AAGH57_14865 [Pseudomonadota bacterium]
MPARVPPSAPRLWIKRALAACLAAALGASLLSASPAAASQKPQIANNVAFFERVALGGLEMSAVNIFYDERCVDPEFCFRQDTLVISVVLFTDRGLREVILRLGERARVPGGDLILTSAGTPPSRQGAIALENYRLQLVFIADEEPAETGAR